MCVTGGKDPGKPSESGTTTSCAAAGAISEAKANELFKKLKANKEIPFNYPVDCCYTRAHEMCSLMKSQGIECRKIWYFDENWGTDAMQSSLKPVKADGTPVTFAGQRVQWVYHVAPLVKVQKADGTCEEMVFDPSMSDRPLTKAEWKSRMGNPKGAYVEETDSSPYFQNSKYGVNKTDPTGAETKKKLGEHRNTRDDALRKGK